MATLFRNSFRSKNYQRVTTSTVITRSLLFWTEALECFWLLHLYASHLCAIDGSKEWFTCLQITVQDSVASIVIGDGNGKTLARHWHHSEWITQTFDVSAPRCTLFGKIPIG